MRIVLRWAVLALSLGACAHGASDARADAEELPERLAGCYELRATKGLYHASPRLRLHADKVSRRTQAFFPDSARATWRVTRLQAGGQPIGDHTHGVLYWWRESPDSVGVMLHTGFSGTELRVRSTASTDTLHGRATEHWDFGPPFDNSGGPVSLVRIPCLEGPGSVRVSSDAGGV